MDIKVLGPGCTNCTTLYATVERAIAQTGVTATLSKVEDYQEIMRYGALATPALVINEKVLAAGRIPDVTHVATWLATAAMEETG